MGLIEAGDLHVRFRPFSVEGEPHQILLENQIWFSSMTTLDDAFEGRPSFVWDETIPTRANLNDRLFALEPNRPLYERLETVEAVLQGLTNDELRLLNMAYIENAVRDLYLKSSVCCFSKNPRSQRFWAQYADKGTGYALLFDFTHPWHIQAMAEKPDIAMVPFPVSYVAGNERPAVRLSLLGMAAQSERFESIQNGLLSKSTEWSDQCEERLIRIGMGGGLVSFNPESLCGIVLGYDQCRANEREALIRECVARQPRIPIYQAYLVGESYEVRLERLVDEQENGGSPA